MIDEKRNARVIEIGFGDGRDAYEILKRTSDYLGIDVSKSFVRIASGYVPNGLFEVGDASTYSYPQNVDIVFAFASLLHSPKEDVALVFQRLEKSLNKGGIVYVSLKGATEYQRYIKSDQFGKRLFYFYTPELIIELAGPSFEVVWQDRQNRPDYEHTQWFTLALKLL